MSLLLVSSFSDPLPVSRRDVDVEQDRRMILQLDSENKDIEEDRLFYCASWDDHPPVCSLFWEENLKVFVDQLDF